MIQSFSLIVNITDQFNAVINERDMMDERNKRAAATNANSGPAQKFDYQERMKWEAEERRKAGYPEPEKKYVFYFVCSSVLIKIKVVISSLDELVLHII